MARQPVASATLRQWQNVLENNFTGGFKTEFTGLNFPENSCTATNNCTFFHTGAVFRRNGFDFESGFTLTNLNRTNSAISTFIWTNVGGDGNTKVYVVQVGALLSFYQFTNATTTSPMSTTLLPSTVSLASFGSTFDNTLECQFAAGNGYLFVYHPSIDPIFCTFASGIVTGQLINIKIRDFQGIQENSAVNFRPPSLVAEHQYNLQNQGWTAGTPWVGTTVSGMSFANVLGPQLFPITQNSSGVLNNGDVVTLVTNVLQELGSSVTASGTVIGYVPNSALTLNLFSINAPGLTTGNSYFAAGTSTFSKSNTGFISTWFSAEGNYPSNADIWWQFKDANQNFNPAVTQPNVALGSAQAPQGSYIFSAFNQNRASVSGIPGLTTVSTTVRPRTGTWFAGRVWYTGVDATQPATGDALQYTWTENIYFSKIVSDVGDFGTCFQTNDPTNQILFDILPNDGGVIVIQGSGSIYKLIPITNGLLVFAANGVWFITGSQGIGFTASDYTISKLSAIQSLSSTSYVDVLGYPMFWNEEGIYGVTIDPNAQGITINSLTLQTIKQFYDKIPKQSKKFARGSYNPITGQVQWLFKATNETSLTNRYAFDSVLTFSTFTQAFYTWTISQPTPAAGPRILDVAYIVGPGGSTSPPPVFKYLTATNANTQITFSEERDNVNWVDWFSAGLSTNYTSSFTTAYRLHGDAQRKFQPTYVYMYSDNSYPASSYILQGQWNYAINPNSGRYSPAQVINISNISSMFGKSYRRLRIPGHGTVLQLTISSVQGLPFNIMGWSLAETQNASV